MDGKNLDSLCIIGLLAIAGIALWLLFRNKREGFKVLGTLGPYSDLYYKCFSECERSDPAHRVYPTKGSFMCGEYCDSVITKMARVGGPSEPKGEKIEAPVVTTPIDDAYRICGDGARGDWCRSLYHSDSEIHEKCAQDCEYSTRPQAECMDLCSKSLSANKSLTGGWSWK